jgi:hypothetical protein
LVAIRERTPRIRPTCAVHHADITAMTKSRLARARRSRAAAACDARYAGSFALDALVLVTVSSLLRGHGSMSVAVGVCSVTPTADLGVTVLIVMRDRTADARALLSWRP